MSKLNIVCVNIVSDKILKLGDAIVNPTNPMMRPGAGVSGEIFRMAGVDSLENYTSQKYGISYFNPPGKNEMKVTEVRITPGFALNKDIISHKVQKCGNMTIMKQHFVFSSKHTQI